MAGDDGYGLFPRPDVLFQLFQRAPFSVIKGGETDGTGIDGTDGRLKGGKLFLHVPAVCAEDGRWRF